MLFPVVETQQESICTGMSHLEALHHDVTWV